MIVCHCNSLTDHAIRKVVRLGARTRSQVVEACSATVGCGGCTPLVDEIIETETSRESVRGLTPFSELAVVS